MTTDFDGVGGESTPAIDPTDHDELLRFTQSSRMNIMGKLNRVDENFKDPKMLGAMLKTLDGIDKQSLVIKRIAADEGIGDRQALAVAALTKAFTNPTAIAEMHAAILASAPARAADSLSVPDDSEDFSLVPGELSPVGQIDNYDTFMARVRNVMPNESAEKAA